MFSQNQVSQKSVIDGRGGGANSYKKDIPYSLHATNQASNDANSDSLKPENHVDKRSCSPLPRRRTHVDKRSCSPLPRRRTPFIAYISIRVLWTMVLASVLAAFLLGRFGTHILHHGIGNYLSSSKLPPASNLVPPLVMKRNLSSAIPVDEQYCKSSSDRNCFSSDTYESQLEGQPKPRCGAAHYELLVQPAMVSQDRPKYVAILGGSGNNGSILREVLKHKSVKKVVIFEIDEQDINATKTRATEISDCSDHESRSSSCFDNKRARIDYVKDEVAWFRDRDESKLFDVIIWDLSEPSSNIASLNPYNSKDNDFIESLLSSVDEEGILVVGTSETRKLADPPKAFRRMSTHEILVEGCERAGFQSTTTYTESTCQRRAPTTFLIALKSKEEIRANWFMAEAEITRNLVGRLLKTKSGESPFHYFDGATMMPYQFPSRIHEEIWCLDNIKWCKGGHGYSPERQNVPISTLKVELSKYEGGGRGVYAKDDIPEGTMIDLEGCSYGFHIPAGSMEIINDCHETFIDHKYWKAIGTGFISGYGWTYQFYGSSTAGVDAGVLTFVNHGCNGTYNVGSQLSETETTLKPGQGPEGVYMTRLGAYDPYSERHYPRWEGHATCEQLRALRDIRAGEEILCNYLTMGGEDEFEWDHNLKELKSMCSGQVTGVAAYESEKRD